MGFVNEKKALSAGATFVLECKSAGSRPAATITFYKNNRVMGKAAHRVSTDLL